MYIIELHDRSNGAIRRLGSYPSLDAARDAVAFWTPTAWEGTTRRMVAPITIGGIRKGDMVIRRTTP